MNVSDYSNKPSISGWKALPLWLMFSVLVVVCFAFPWGEDHLYYFYVEQLPLVVSLLLFVGTAFSGGLKIKVPTGFYYFAVAAVFVWWQARVLHLPLTGPNDGAAAVLLICGFLYWAVKGLSAKYGQQQILTIVAWLLLIGSLLQSMVAILQLTEWLAPWGGYIFYSGGEPSGQVGQRNHLGHYMMWGVLSTAYLWSARKMSATLAVICLLALAAVLGIVRSRTILVYLMAILPLVPLLWFKVSRKAAGILLFTLAVVGLMQVVSPLLVTSFVRSDFESALQRAGESGFAHSGRYYEWLKAWEAFKSAPWLGHGWDGFAYQSFLINNSPEGYRPYDTSVLFTHCHNLVLQLLATMGGVGALILVGGFVAVAVVSLKKGFTAASGFVLAMLLVTVCHSMLEYPLWYLYFMVMFTVLFALLGDDAQAVESTVAADAPKQVITKSAFTGFVVVMVVLVGLFRLEYSYYRMLVSPETQNLSQEEAWTQETGKMMYLYNNESLLKLNVLIKLAVKTGDFVYMKKEVPNWIPRVHSELAVQRPYSLAFYHGLHLERQGKHQEALAWLDKVYRYYPEQMSKYAVALRQDARFTPLYPQAEQACADIARVLPHLQRCEPVTKPVTNK